MTGVLFFGHGIASFFSYLDRVHLQCSCRHGYFSYSLGILWPLLPLAEYYLHFDTIMYYYVLPMPIQSFSLGVHDMERHSYSNVRDQAYLYTCKFCVRTLPESR